MQLSVFNRLVLSGVLIIPVSFSVSVQAANPNQSALNQLSAFLAQLERQHPRLKASQFAIEAAQARARAASRPIYNPEIEFSTERVGFNSNHIDTAILGINQTLDWHNKRAAKQNISAVGLQATQYEQDSVRQQLIADIFSALADYQVQREIIQAHSKRLALSKQVLSQATWLETVKARTHRRYGNSSVWHFDAVLKRHPAVGSRVVVKYHGRHF